MQVMRRFMRFFFHHFYHSFAWTYDFIAAFVSIGRWNDWIGVSVPFIEGRHILEVGHGPGHLQKRLKADPGRTVVGVDESPQMGRLAKRRLEKAGSTPANLARSLAQSLPFPARTFDTVVSTFPAEYIFDPQTMSDVNRVLENSGRFVVLPAAWIVGRKFLDRSAAWLFKVTGQAPTFPHNVLSERVRKPFEEAGFHPEFKTIEIESSLVLIVIATKSV